MENFTEPDNILVKVVSTKYLCKANFLKAKETITYLEKDYAGSLGIVNGLIYGMYMREDHHPQIKSHMIQITETTEVNYYFIAVTKLGIAIDWIVFCPNTL